ncbi:MAG TPA: hypothetical protein VGA88_09240 [Burkholderiales bacterium]|jgi:hypothetical protein
MAGISSKQVLLALALDQLIFTFMDFSMGAMANRVARVVGRLAHAILGCTPTALWLLAGLLLLLLPAQRKLMA